MSAAVCHMVNAPQQKQSPAANASLHASHPLPPAPQVLLSYNVSSGCHSQPERQSQPISATLPRQQSQLTSDTVKRRRLLEMIIICCCRTWAGEQAKLPDRSSKVTSTCLPSSTCKKSEGVTPEAFLAKHCCKLWLFSVHTIYNLQGLGAVQLIQHEAAPGGPWCCSP